MDFGDKTVIKDLSFDVYKYLGFWEAMGLEKRPQYAPCLACTNQRAASSWLVESHSLFRLA
jgi:hypothetical protein